jgi:hypothetical protein
MTALPQLQARLTQIQAELVALGSIHPGSLSTQYNVCGTPGCQCKDPRAPQKHGPYSQLSYTWRGKSTTRFVRPGRVPVLREKLARYQRFRELTAEWVDVAIAVEALERQAANELAK